MITRLDGVTCAICMESLFCKRDDLDELYPISTPDCGHVFHDECLKSWFNTQSHAHLAAQREIRGRSISPSEISDAPAECPTCRTECFADDETREPLVHRLYINFEGNGYDGSSQAGSSPVRDAWRKRKGQDEVMMGLARRAKGIGEETKDLANSPEVEEEDFEAVMKRAGALEGDLISQKASDGIKRYVGGLTSALNNLRSSIVDHPLIPTLRAETAAAKAAEASVRREMKRLIATHMPQEIQRAIQVEQDRCKREVKKVKEEMNAVKRELEKEGVLRRTGKREMEERLKAEEKKTADAVTLARKETIEREKLQATLNERMRSLKSYQAKAEGRKDLKAQVADLEAENAQLRTKLEKAVSASTPRRPVICKSHSASRHSKDGSLEIDLDNDQYFFENSERSIVEISPRRFQPRLNHNEAFDVSLEVELPSFAMSASRPSVAARARSHPVARTIAYDLSKPGGGPRPPKRPHHSKYFPPEPAPSEGQQSDALFDDEDQLVPASSEDESSLVNPSKRSRTNPFASNREETDRKKVLAPKQTIPAVGRSGQRRAEPVEISSSPESRAKPIRTSHAEESGSASTGSSKARAAGSMQGRKSPVRKQPSMIEFLGIVDKNGRPTKGLALGAKVRRKA